MTRKTFIYFAIFLVALLVGFLVSRQLLLTKRAVQALRPETFEALTLEVSSLLSDNQKLSSKVEALEEQKSKLANIFSNRQAALESLDKQIKALEVATGEKQVTGPGVLVYIDQDLSLAQLVDLLNAVRNSGAEAIALNGKRIIANTSLNEPAFIKPYSLQVIGEVEVLADSLSRRGGILDQIVEGEVSKHDRLILPATS